MITLDEIIDGYMLQNELPDGMHFRIEQLAIRGYRQLHYNAIGLPKTAILNVMGNNTADLPCDFLSKIRLGITNGRGEITALVEDNIINLKSRKPTAGASTDIEEDYLFDEFGTYNGYPLLDQQLGMGSLNSPGRYRIDYDCGAVILQPNFNYNQITLEYLPLASDGDKGYVVHPFFQEALVAWLKWQDSVGRVKFSNERELNKMDYDRAYLQAKRAMNPFNVGDYYNQWRQSIRSAIKS